MFRQNLTDMWFLILFVHAYPYMHFTHHAFIWYILPLSLSLSLSLSHTHTHKRTYTGIPPEDNPNRVLNDIH